MTVSQPPDGRCWWTVETVLEHLCALIEANDKRYEQQFESLQQAITLGLDAVRSSVEAQLEAQNTAVIKAEAATERRFEGVNEFRNTLSDQQRNLMPRSEVDVLMLGVHQKIAALEKAQDAAVAERLGVRGGWGYAVGAAGLVLTLFSLFMVLWKFKP